jgi:hypothetical protein
MDALAIVLIVLVVGRVGLDDVFCIRRGEL